MPDETLGEAVFQRGDPSPEDVHNFLERVPRIMGVAATYVTEYSIGRPVTHDARKVSKTTFQTLACKLAAPRP